MRTKYLLALCFLGMLGFTFCGCQEFNTENSVSSPNIALEQSDNYRAKDSEFEQQTPDPLQTTTAVGDNTTKKIIRKAQLKFRVKQVETSTNNLEQMVSGLNGYITSNNLSTDVERVEQKKYSTDSVLEATWYNVNNTMTILVPEAYLDSALKIISGQVEFLEYRNISGEDVSLRLFSNHLKQKRYNSGAHRLSNASDKYTKTLDQRTTAEEVLIEQQQHRDEALVNNMYLAQQIEFSEITLNFYQRPLVEVEIIPDMVRADLLEVGFGQRMWESINWGWHLITEVFLGILRFWLIILVALVSWVFYRRYNLRKAG